MPLFVTLEGIEGAGKSSLQRTLAEALGQEFPEVVVTREPGATRLGKSIRALLLDPENTCLSAQAELALFAADRAQHVHEIIRPALARGALVISDRFTHSTLAYQGYGRGLPLEQLRQFNQLATGGLEPDVVLLLDLCPEEGLYRARGRYNEHFQGAAPANPACAALDHGWSRFEEEELAFHTRIREGYLELARQEGSKFVLINAAQSQVQVAQDAAAALRLHLPGSARK